MALSKKEQKERYYERHTDECKARMKKHARRVKIKVLAAYCQETIQCKRCGESDIDVLALDHINSNGNEHRKIRKDVYADVIQRGFPDGFQVLCANCNYLKRCENQETRPANGKTTEIHRRYHSKLRLEILSAYSGGLNICRKCGKDDIRVLCLDHIQGDGHEHRRKLGAYGTWRDLKRRDYPPVAQVLCHNCNRRKMHENNEFGIRFSVNRKDDNAN